ncbi:MAG: RNA polymerase sigma-54 factor, partial [Bacteroidota bacterium]
MQKLGLNQTLSQRLSPQQIQFIKLLQIPTSELEARIEQELEVNPALEEGRDQEEEIPAQAEDDFGESEQEDYSEEISVEDYLAEDEFSGYKMQGDGSYNDEDDKDLPMPTAVSLVEQLVTQLNFLRLDERRQQIGLQLIGSIESDGYIRRDLDAIVNDLAFSLNIDTSAEELEEILSKIQHFDPPGIGARSLQECLLLQLERKPDQDRYTRVAIDIIENNF